VLIFLKEPKFSPLTRLENTGLVRDAEIAKRKIIFGESGDTDSPKEVFGCSENLSEQTKQVLSWRPLRLCGESNHDFLGIRDENSAFGT
jgi:hypothetical protein